MIRQMNPINVPVNFLILLNPLIRKDEKVNVTCTKKKKSQIAKYIFIHPWLRIYAQRKTQHDCTVRVKYYITPISPNK